MATLVTIKAPNKTKTALVKVSGYVIRLYVGLSQEKLLLQQTPQGEVVLTHYASGLNMGSLTPIKLAAARSGRNLTDREAAVSRIDQLISRLGVDKVRETMATAEVIN